MRAAALALGTWLLAGVARADVPPPPTRPDWPDTPLPMPSDPFVFVALAAVLVVAVAVAHRARR